MNPDLDYVGFRYPFGEESCEHEVAVLQEKYQEYFYDQSRFNEEILARDTYLVVGRRGSGKTSLARYLTFQNRIRNARCIDVDEPDVYNQALQDIANSSPYYSLDITTKRIEEVWEFLIWALIFNEYQDYSGDIKAATLMLSPRVEVARLASKFLKQLLMHWLNDGGNLANEIEKLLSSSKFMKAQSQVLEIVATEPVIVAVDTIERYDPYNDALMATVTGLIQCANKFNILYATKGIYVKVFMSAEIYPHLVETVIPNPTKQVRYPVFLYWRPKDLIRLSSWRFYRYLINNPQIKPQPPSLINWDKFQDVLEKMWYPYFGKTVVNLRGFEESSFPYILRHTQMRPRQLVVLCNTIAKAAIQAEVFPELHKVSISRIVKETEKKLAVEILNSYSKIYPGVAKIVDALRSAPMIFDGSYLDKVAPTTAAAWERGTYSPANFRQLVTELGIVGRIRSLDEKSGIASADFEYNLSDRLGITSNDKCAIHPMFYSKLQIQRDSRVIVYPFPDHPDFNEIVT